MYEFKIKLGTAVLMEFKRHPHSLYMKYENYNSVIGVGPIFLQVLRFPPPIKLTATI
jgi:hypothetical protein